MSALLPRPGDPLDLDNGIMATNFYHGHKCVVCGSWPSVLYTFKDNWELFLCDICFDVFETPRTVERWIAKVEAEGLEF